MRHAFLILTLTLTFGMPLARADEPAAWNFKSTKANEAVRKYKAACKKLDEAYEQQRTQNRAALIAKLDGAVKEVTKAQDLDDAVAIRDTIKALQAPAKGAAEEDAGEKDEKVASRIPKTALRFGKHHYQAVHSPGITWQKAQQLCKKMGGHLATIQSPEEFGFLDRMHRAVPGENKWIGGANFKGNWRWVDGSPIDGRYWFQGRPSPLAGADFVYISSVGSFWNDRSPHNNIPGFICEWDE